MVVTGSSSSRLSELRKYAVTNDFTKQYICGGSYNVDGVDYNVSPNENNVTYYLGGIKYNDVQITSGEVPYTGTTYSFFSSGTSSPDFINAPIYKDPKRENIIDKPKINSDVFIVRQELNIFEKNYRLEHVTNLLELVTYAGGNYFNIVNNS